MSVSEMSGLRAANIDRERVVERLNRAHAEGRVDLNELDERLAAAYAARTYRDLEPLTADLPAERARPDAAGTRPDVPGTRPAGSGRPAVPGARLRGHALALRIEGGPGCSPAW